MHVCMCVLRIHVFSHMLRFMKVTRRTLLKTVTGIGLSTCGDNVLVIRAGGGPEADWALEGMRHTVNVRVRVLVFLLLCFAHVLAAL